MALKALLPQQQMTKEYGVLVTTGDQVPVIKEFDNEKDADILMEQLKKFTTVTGEKIVRQMFGKQGRLTSLAWERRVIEKTGAIDYHIVRVPTKRGLLFCTECHDYRKFEVLPNSWGATANRCPICTMSDQDFYVKTANGLWGSPYEAETKEVKKPQAPKTTEIKLDADDQESA